MHYSHAASSRNTALSLQALSEYPHIVSAGRTPAAESPAVGVPRALTSYLPPHVRSAYARMVRDVITAHAAASRDALARQSSVAAAAVTRFDPLTGAPLLEDARAASAAIAKWRGAVEWLQVGGPY